MSTPHPGARLLGRRRECAALDRLVDDVRAVRSSALVVRGEAGVGKSALLTYVEERASGCRVARATYFSRASRCAGMVSSTTGRSRRCRT
jgi:predicted ATP-dependent serine protease